jgi:rsbT co-antagonist protein RsbR
MHSDAIIGKGSPDGPTIERCLSGGLWDAGVQLKAKGHPIANWLIGQVRDESIRDEDLLEYAREIGADEEAFQSALQEVTVMSREQFEQVAQSLYEIANQLSALAASNLEAHQRASEQEKFQRQIIQAQKEALKELSSPIVPVLEGVVVMPLIGTIDTSRSQVIIETLLESIVEQKARVVLIDITGVPVVDTSVANYILHMTNAARLLGSEAILVGISPEVAQTIVSMGVDLSGIKTRGNLQAGVEYALRVQGWKLERE